MLKLLLIEDCADDEFLLLRELRKGGFQVQHRRVDSLSGLEEALKMETWDLIVSDFHLPGFSGLESLESFKASGQDCPFLLVSGTIGEEAAVSAMRAGAHDFLIKGNYSRLIPAIRRELKEAEGRRARRQAEESLLHTHRKLETAYRELRDAHEQMVRQERLKVLGEMAGGVAHDFNNALASIQGLAETLLMYPETLEDTAQVQEFLEMIRTAAEDAANVVKRLGEFYRDQGVPAEMERVELGALAEQVLQLTQAKWKALTRTRGIQVEVVCQFAEPLHTLGHPAELRQALTNLIFNAVDAMPQGGQLTLRTRRAGEVVCLEVQDSGIGMDAATRDRCMEPFFSTKGEAGTGLGLAMVYGIVRRHQAVMEIESTPGQGTTFRLCFSEAGEESLPAQVAPQAARALQRSLKVLLAEEDPLLRQVLSRFLGVEGHLVQLSEDGLQVLQQLEQDRFDVIVFSRSLPGLTGTQLSRQLSQQYPELPQVLLSGVLRGEVPAGVTRTVAKPFTLNLFRQALQEAVADRGLARPPR